MGLRDLGDATVDDLAKVRDRMSVESYKRCHHIISENARVRAMREALHAGDPQVAGELMLRAHASQRDDFACSCAEIDFLVATAASLPGCFGARMTGGGFGGCTVNLVRRDAVESFRAALTAAYAKELTLNAETFVFTAVDGALRRNRGTAAESSHEVKHRAGLPNRSFASRRTGGGPRCAGPGWWCRRTARSGRGRVRPKHRPLRLRSNLIRSAICVPAT